MICLSFKISHAGDFFFLNLSLFTAAGEELAVCENNQIKCSERPDLQFSRVPGRVVLRAPCTEEFLPWGLQQRIQTADPEFGVHGAIDLLDIEVSSPGTVRIQGVWLCQEGAVVITKTAIHLIRPDHQGPLSMSGGANGPCEAEVAGVNAFIGFGPNAALSVS